MKNDTTPSPEIKRALSLKKERIDILSLPPKKALDRILDYPQPAALVHSFPEEDFYFLIHDIGAEDALPLLSLASGKQLDFILDQEIWEKDRIINSSLTRWFGLMLNADPQRFLNWIKQEKTNLLEFYLYHNIDIRILEHDQDPSEFGDDFQTLDGVYYFRILPNLSVSSTDETGEAADGISEEFRETLLQSLLKGLAGLDHKNFQHILLESATLLPAESEEEAYRWRNVRLAEKGFLPFDEAIGIYQPMTEQDFYEATKTFNNKAPRSKPHAPVPLMPIKMLEGNNVFSDALISLSLDDRFSELQEEFAALCNQLIVADQKLVRNKEDLQTIVKKACGYINIGLNKLHRKGPDMPNAREIILNHALSHLFKLGFGMALSLKWRVQKWTQKNWFSSQGLSLTFWGEDWMGVLGGLLIKRPLYFDNYKTGVLYREFESVGDILKTQSILDDVISCDHLLLRVAPEIETSSELGYLSYKNVLLTLWVKHCLGMTENLIPMKMSEFKKFYGGLWETQTKPKKISESIKTDFVEFLSKRAGKNPKDILKQARSYLEDLFMELESEFSEVDVGSIDPRFISLFLLEKPNL